MKHSIPQNSHSLNEIMLWVSVHSSLIGPNGLGGAGAWKQSSPLGRCRETDRGAGAELKLIDQTGWGAGAEMRPIDQTKHSLQRDNNRQVLEVSETISGKEGVRLKAEEAPMPVFSGRAEMSSQEGHFGHTQWRPTGSTGWDSQTASGG